MGFRRPRPRRLDARKAHARAGRPRLIALALIAEAPRHGYEIIKLLEEKTADWYSPSPGIIYPTLTYLEEAGYVTASAEGSKKLYTITEEGSAYLEANREIVDAVLDRLSALGERVNRWRQRVRGERGERGSLPPLTEAAEAASPMPAGAPLSTARFAISMHSFCFS